MRPKFPKFKWDKNAAEKFWIGINESKKLWKSIKVDEIIIQHNLQWWNFIKISCNTVNFHLIPYETKIFLLNFATLTWKFCWIFIAVCSLLSMHFSLPEFHTVLLFHDLNLSTYTTESKPVSCWIIIPTSPPTADGWAEKQTWQLMLQNRQAGRLTGWQTVTCKLSNRWLGVQSARQLEDRQSSYKLTNR